MTPVGTDAEAAIGNVVIEHVVGAAVALAVPQAAVARHTGGTACPTASVAARPTKRYLKPHRLRVLAGFAWIEDLPDECRSILRRYLIRMIHYQDV